MEAKAMEAWKMTFHFNWGFFGWFHLSFRGCTMGGNRWRFFSLKKKNIPIWIHRLSQAKGELQRKFCCLVTFWCATKRLRCALPAKNARISSNRNEQLNDHSFPPKKWIQYPVPPKIHRKSAQKEPCFKGKCIFQPSIFM